MIYFLCLYAARETIEERKQKWLKQDVADHVCFRVGIMMRQITVFARFMKEIHRYKKLILGPGVVGFVVNIS